MPGTVQVPNKMLTVWINEYSLKRPIKMGLSDLIYNLAKHMLQRCQNTFFNTFANCVKMRDTEKLY